MNKGVRRFRIGDRVTYQAFPGKKSDVGSVTSINENWVFVHYDGTTLDGQATDPRDLEHVEEKPGVESAKHMIVVTASLVAKVAKDSGGCMSAVPEGYMDSLQDAVWALEKLEKD